MANYSATFEYPCGEIRKVNSKDNPKFRGCARFNYARPVVITVNGNISVEDVNALKRMVNPQIGVVVIKP